MGSSMSAIYDDEKENHNNRLAKMQRPVIYRLQTKPLEVTEQQGQCGGCFKKVCNPKICDEKEHIHVFMEQSYPGKNVAVSGRFNLDKTPVFDIKITEKSDEQIMGELLRHMEHIQQKKQRR